MNNDTADPADKKLLKQIDDALERGKRSNLTAVNMLVSTMPKADRVFQQHLEELLVTQLQQQHFQNKELKNMQMTAKASPRVPSVSMWVWAAAILAVALVGSFTLIHFQSRSSLPTFAAQVITEPIPQNVVIATRNIRAGDTVTDEMVALVSLLPEDFAALQSSQPDRQFFQSLDDVIGQTATTAIFWFEPVEPIKLGQFPEFCAVGSQYCLNVPVGYYTINFPHPFVGLAQQGIVAGDRVDILAVADGEMKVIARDVLLAQVTPDDVTFAAPSWKQSVLIWLWRTEQPYTLQFSEMPDNAPVIAGDARVEYSFTAPELLPDDYLFDLVAEFPVSESYLLADAPDLDTIQFTQRDQIMNFWFTDLDVISITDGINVVIRLPEQDAANLDFLLTQGAELTFIPQSE